MSSGDGDHRNGKGPAEEAQEEDKFPAGLRVLAVDDDPVFLNVLGALLRFCKYKATTVTEGRTALEILRERGEEQFDLVITDLHMPDMDGFKLLDLIGLEMDLPVIMISVNGEKATMYKGIVHGACDYLVKPVNIKQLKNIWQHVVRKNQVAINHNSSESDDDDDDDDDDANQRMVQPVTAEHGRGDAKKSKKHLKKKKNGGHESDKNRRVPTTQKKPRVSWNGDLHNRFIEAVNLLGVDRAVPKTILQVMNVKNLSRESVGSHLQKYRLFLKRIAEETEKYDPVDDSSDDEMDINPPVQPSSAVCCCGSNMPCTAPSIIGPHGLSIRPRNRSMASNGESMARNAAAPPVESSEDRPMLDLFHPHRSTKAYVGILREKLLEASSMVPASHPINSSVEEMPDGEPANQFPVQPSSFPGPMNGSPVVPAQVTMLQINQLPSFGASSSQTAVFQSEQQNQMAGIFSNNSATPMVGFNTQMTPLFCIASNTGPAVEMTQMMVNGGSTSSPFPSLGMTNGGSSSVGPPPSQMANGGGISSSSALPGLQDDSAAPADGGDVSGILPMQDGPSDQQSPVDDQPTPSTNLFLQQIFSSMVNPDFNPDGAPFGEEY